MTADPYAIAVTPHALAAIDEARAIVRSQLPEGDAVRDVLMDTLDAVRDNRYTACS